MMKIYEITQENLPITVDEKEVIFTSELNLSYLQGVRDAFGVKAILIGNRGKEIQILDETPYYTECSSVDAAVKSVILLLLTILLNTMAIRLTMNMVVSLF